ncbi:ATP-dependent DNA helicase RecG [Desulfofundulus sp. TPOSR]|uniref:ATP-dependent DNA helicase RecG n=1 Tax=Desulfofundulus kuznetsovii (strain DSM 6115 / VKM B-1805 / 17) TaxID=760568 RepID=A0AAU8Q1S7_DESK7|nr:ATP-dependent DNA helicase RecG [Desulfofundulus sp. TPOSR]AEG14833.1 ATP-dependent DNA helicase RecG [Desulfofundulus kuznetsovii DSM 6115]NHM25700.1 ATP-dependent DNA helicase RecG [Desulfofundulus sp. TPOSR]
MVEVDFEQYPVQYLKMVGPRRFALLKRLGIRTVKDLLYHFPREYQERTVKPSYACAHGEQVTLQGRVVGVTELSPRSGLWITRVKVQEPTGHFFAVWFNQRYIKKLFTAGSRVQVTGKIERRFGEIQLLVADYELLEGEEPVPQEGIVPIYPLTEQLTQRLMRSLMRLALDEWTPRINDFLPPGVRQKFFLPELPSALCQIHFPATEKEAIRARKRFIFEELFLLQLVLALRRRQITRKLKPHRYHDHEDLVGRFLSSLPFTLTPGQQRAWEEIKADMDAPWPMNRLLQGDVGAGKTVVSTLALLRAVGSGLQGALMVPTEILAEQHHLTLSRSLASLGIKVGLLSGSMRKKERERLLAGLACGEIPLVVGTHALIQEKVQFKSLALVVIDEQHRFGVRQRAILQYKGHCPDVLVMTATPIPRTLALTLYGDLEVSTISELPPGRRPVQTYAFPSSRLPDVYGLVRREVEKGHQAYVVCPLVEESEKLDVRAAVELMEELSRGPLAGCRLGLLHGRLKPAEKEDVMEAFRTGQIQVLVTTSVVEVGVDVPNATVMVILDAERFGLAQLHQLRGRVGRGKAQSYCVLVSDSTTEEARYRLQAMTSTTDGFVLAEKDLQLRGPGELTGTRQSGLPEFKIADLVRDWRALQLARQEAVALIKKDPELKAPEHRLLARELRLRFGGKAGYLDIG